MIEIVVPGRGSYALKHLLLDMNGTLALDGQLLEGVRERLEQLGKLLEIRIVTADTYGTADRLAHDLQIAVHRIAGGQENAQKVELVRTLGSQSIVAIGNGANDVSMLRESAIGICVLGGECSATEALLSSDVVAADINAALDLLLNPKRLVATLRR